MASRGVIGRPREDGLCIPSGVFVFQIKPYGLTNAFATSQQLLNTVLEELTSPRCFVYLDDVIAQICIGDEHLGKQEVVANVVEVADLRRKPWNWKLLPKQMKILVRLISRRGF